jgi:hypothetical protein
MQTTPEEVQSKNPTELLRDQVLLLQELQRSVQEMNETQTRMLESLSGLHAITERSREEQVNVNVVDINMPFGSMVGFIVKWSIASIPAALVLGAIGVVIWLLLMVVFGGVFSAFGS